MDFIFDSGMRGTGHTLGKFYASTTIELQVQPIFTNQSHSPISVLASVTQQPHPGTIR
jgi:hypothetical protein